MTCLFISNRVFILKQWPHVLDHLQMLHKALKCQNNNTKNYFKLVIRNGLHKAEVIFVSIHYLKLKKMMTVITFKH